MNNTLAEKTAQVSKVLLAIVLYLFTGELLQFIGISYLQNKEQIADAAALQSRFVELGLAIYVLAGRAVLAVPLLWLLLKKDGAQELDFKRFMHEKHLNWILLILLGIAASIGCNQLLSLTHLAEKSQSYQGTREYLYSGGFWISLLTVGVLVPIAEELLFRGYIFNKLKELCKPQTVIIITALIFGIYHMNPVQFVYAFVMGLILGYVLQRFQSIFAAVLVHMSANIFVYATSGLDFWSQGWIPYLTAAFGLLLTAAIVIVFVQKDRK